VAEDRFKWWSLVSKSNGKEHLSSIEDKKKVFYIVHSVLCNSIFTVSANKCTQLSFNSQ